MKYWVAQSRQMGKTSATEAFRSRLKGDITLDEIGYWPKCANRPATALGGVLTRESGLREPCRGNARECRALPSEAKQP